MCCLRSTCACSAIRVAGCSRPRLELANWARDWYTRNGRPWFYARQSEIFEIRGDSIHIDGIQFTSKRMQATLQQAKAHQHNSGCGWPRVLKLRKNLAGAGRREA